MRLTDFKFLYITRQDDIHISKAAVRFYEGEVTTENHRDIRTKEMVPVTRYRRSERLQKEDLPHIKNREVIKDPLGDDAFIFTSEDFGVITTNAELEEYFKGLIKQDKTRLSAFD